MPAGWVHLLCVLYLVRLSSSHASLEDTVLLLKGQVQALLDNRQSEQQLTAQISALRDEIRELRSKTGKVKSLEVRLEWLEGSVAETRGQVSELGAALEKTNIIPIKMHSVQSELRAQADQLQQFSQQLATLNSEVVARPQVPSETSPPKETIENELTRIDSEYAEEKRYRHRRVLRKQVEALEASNKALKEGQARLGKEMGSLEKRVAGVEGNWSGETGGLHASMLQLLESVEALETKLDSNLPNLQRELSRTELSLAQVIQEGAIVKEEQENQRVTVKALSVGMSTMQEKLNKIFHQNQEHRTEAPAPTPPVHNSTEQKVETGQLVEDLNKVVGEYEGLMKRLPHDCSGLHGVKGLEMIRPGGVGNPILVQCDDGWTVLQRRSDGSVLFNRGWEEYAQGFGSPAGEFWIGNEALHRLTKDNTSSLRIDMVDIYGKSWLAEYKELSVGSREEGFRLLVGGYSGNASDALDYQNNMQFSTKDEDRDISNTHCAANYEGGWWFSHCQHANLNGRYNLGLTWFHADKNEWIAVAQSTMKIRPRA